MEIGYPEYLCQRALLENKDNYIEATTWIGEKIEAWKGQKAILAKEVISQSRNERQMNLFIDKKNIVEDTKQHLQTYGEKLFLGNHVKKLQS